MKDEQPPIPTPQTDAFIDDMVERGLPLDKQQWEIRKHARQLERELAEAKRQLACGGPLNTERWTLREFMAEMEKVKAIASDKTCVSFERFCWGASSLWHQTHREAYRKIKAEPEALSQYVLKERGCLMDDFPNQVLQLLIELKAGQERWRDMARKLADSLAHMQYCCECGESNWSGCEGGRKAEEALAEFNALNETKS